MIVKAGSTDVTTYFHLRLAADGTDATGLTITDFDLQYTRSGATPAAKVDATALGAANSAHGDNQAIEIDATDQPGVYRVDWPDAAFASGAREVILTVKCATVFTESLRVDLTAVAADVMALNGVAAAAARLALSAGQIIPGTIDNTVAPTAAIFEADDITEATANHYAGRVILFTTGALVGQATAIEQYALVAGRGRFTVVELTEAPGNNDTFVII
jgi:hypothetical protein